MHGVIHVIFKHFIIDKFGVVAWATILKRAGVDDDTTITEMRAYDDTLTFAAIKIACEVAEVPMEAALELFGGYFVEFAAKEGWVPLLSSLGKNLFELLSNLNVLHHNVERDIAAAIFPVFEVTNLRGAPGDKEHTFRLLYGTGRPGLDPLLKGALMKVADVLFNSTLKIEEVSRSSKSSPSSPPTGSAALLDDVGSEISLEILFEVKVQRNDTKTLPTDTTSAQPALGLSFFDFHALFMPFSCSGSKCAPKCCQNANAAETVTVESQNSDAIGSKWQDDTQYALLATTLKGKRELVELIVASPGAAQGTGAKHPYFQMAAEDRMKVGTCLLRGVKAEHVGAPWRKEAALKQTTDFWSAYAKLDVFYALSADIYGSGSSDVYGASQKSGKLYFLSQSWGEPTRWKELMGGSYAEAKAAELCCVAKDIASAEMGNVDRWPEVEFWIDKCCIPQGDQYLMEWCVNELEEFMVLSDGLIVLSPWTYFTRLWCVYEWVCFLCAHDASDILICADPFLRDTTMGLYIDVIKNFKLEKCECYKDSDKQILFAKVDEYYRTPALFERFLKFTAVALFTRCAASRRSGKARAAISPWETLAKDLGFHDLAGRLDSMTKQLPAWRAEAVGQVKGGATKDIQSQVNAKVEEWFKNEVAPLIAKERMASVRAEGLEYIQTLKKARPARELPVP